MTNTHAPVSAGKAGSILTMLSGPGLMLALLFLIFMSHPLPADESVFPEPPRAQDGTVLVPSRGEWVDPDEISSGVCINAMGSNVKTEAEVYGIEKAVFYHASTTDTAADRNERAREWWVRAMPHINCYDRVYNGFEGGSPLNLMAYQGYGLQIIYLMRKYELPPEYLMYPDPRTGLNLFEWMEERVEDDYYAEVTREMIANELRLLTRWFTRIGYFE